MRPRASESGASSPPSRGTWSPRPGPSSRSTCGSGELAQLGGLRRLGVGADMHDARAAAAEPVGVEDLVELEPVGPARAEQRLERGPQAGRPRRQIGRQNPRRVLALLEADGEGVVAQRAREAGQARESMLAHIGAIAHSSWRGRHQATFPSRRAATSRVRRARSSCVFSRQRSVS